MPELNFGRFNKEQQETILKEFIAERLADIIQTQKSLGLKASGESAASLEVEAKEIVGGEIVRAELIDGSGSFYFQEKGRGPYTGGPKIVGGLWGRIYTWLRYKKYGLNWTDKKARIALAWAITKKIQKYGTYTHFDSGEPTGVISKPLDEEKMKVLGDRIMTIENVVEIKNALMKDLFK